MNMQQAILRLLDDVEGELCAQDIATLLALNEQSVRAAVGKLHRDGKVTGVRKPLPFTRKPVFFYGAIREGVTK